MEFLCIKPTDKANQDGASVDYEEVSVNTKEDERSDMEQLLMSFVGDLEQLRASQQHVLHLKSHVTKLEEKLEALEQRDILNDSPTAGFVYQLELRLSTLEDLVKRTLLEQQRGPISESNEVPIASEILFEQTQTLRSSKVSVEKSVSRRRSHSSKRSSHSSKASEQKFESEETVELQREHLDEDNFMFENSVWHIAIFIGHHCVGSIGSCYAVAMLLLNVLIQVCFCIIVNDHMTQPIINDSVLEDLRQWRHGDAHSATHFDHVSSLTLAERVCSQEPSSVATAQADFLSSIDAYLPQQMQDPNFAGFFVFNFVWHNVGPCMCILALVCWFWTVSQDLYETGQLCRSFCRLSLGATTLVNCDDCYDLVLVHSLRKIWVYSIACCRLLIGIFLLYSGALWIIFTLELGNLILNAVALEFVLSIDELIFDVLAPAQSKKLLAGLMCLKMPFVRSFKGVDVIATIRFLATLFLLALPVSVVVQQEGQLRQARDIICGGNLRFLLGRSTLGIVMWTGLEDLHEAGDTYMYEAATTLINQGNEGIAGLSGFDVGQAKTLGFAGSTMSFSRQLSEPLRLQIDLVNFLCQDVFPVYVRSIGAVRQALQDDSVNDCAAGIMYCNKDSMAGARMRQFCPKTCGCRDPTSMLAFVGASQGCPSSCQSHPTYISIMQDLPCQDQSVNSLVFAEFASTMKDAVSGNPGEPWPAWQRAITFVVAELIQKHGCSAVDMVRQGQASATLPQFSTRGLDMCVGAYELKGLRALCPATCGCSNGTMTGCPLTCLGQR